MLNTQDLDSINLFLNICKKEIKKGNCYFAGYRILDMNWKYVSAKQALINIGIMNINEIWRHISNLEMKDCIKIDYDHDISKDMNSEIYIFKKIINRFFQKSFIAVFVHTNS